MPVSDPYYNTAIARRVLREEGRRYWLAYAAGFALTALIAACTSLTAYIAGQLVNSTYLGKDLTRLAILSFASVIVFSVKGVAAYAQAILATWISNDITARNQQLLFDRLLNQNLAYFGEHPSSYFAGRLNYCARSSADFLNLLLNSIGRDGFLLVGLVVVMISQDAVMSTIAFVVMPLAFLVNRKLIKPIRVVTTKTFNSSARLSEIIHETLIGLRVVKAFELEDDARQRLAQEVELVRRNGVHLAKLSSRSRPLMESLGGIAIAVVFLYGGYNVIQNGASGGEFVAFITAFVLAYEPAKRIGRARLSLEGTFVGLRMFYEWIDNPSAETRADGRPNLCVKEGRIEFQNVSFEYNAGVPVLRQLKLSAGPRQLTALVGQSGGGKTTTFGLLLGFYKPSSGCILIDDQDIAKVSPHSLRSQIAYVSQDMFLFRTSVAANIAVGKPGASKEEIVAAAKKAHAHHFIESFPQGYETLVGEQGLTLSPGQRQRVALARAFIRNAPIVLLDEPTSALDTQSEREVQRAISELCANRTALVIAHRLHTIVKADAIAVMEQGQVIEIGSHEKLIRQAGAYAVYQAVNFRGPDQTRGVKDEDEIKIARSDAISGPIASSLPD